MDEERRNQSPVKEKHNKKPNKKNIFFKQGQMIKTLF